MKLQHLSVIFVIIIVPITMVLSTYVDNMINVANKERAYDNALYNATYDAVRAYQMNTLNNTYASVNTSRNRDVKATVNSFFNSLKNGLSLSGYSKEELNNYVPSLLFTLYDGFYVYGPFENVVTSAGEYPEFTQNTNNLKVEYGLKPFINYSCQYSSSGAKNYNLIVNYTLDNYISVNGWYLNTLGEKIYLTKAGYYINPNIISFNDAQKIVNVNGMSIEPEILQEYISVVDEDKIPDSTRIIITKASEPTLYQYINYHDEKYYYDLSPDTNNRSWSDTQRIPIFTLSGDTRTYINQDMLDTLSNYLGASNLKTSNAEFKDVNAYYYYKNAVEFSETVYPALSLIDLSDESVIKTSVYNKTYSITNENYQKVDDNTNGTSSHTKTDYTNKKVFDYSDSDNNPELDSSSFNEHRMDVIISIIEDTLATAITNYNNYFSSGYAFRMPTLKETDWNVIANNVTTVSFLQGLVIGNYKYYNNYSVVANTKNKEFVSKEAIYVEDNAYIGNYSQNQSNYHNPRCIEYNKTLNNDSENHIIKGFRIIDYEIQSLSQRNYLYTDDNGIIHEVKEGVDQQDPDSGLKENNLSYYLRPGTGAYECVIALNENKFTSDNLMQNTTIKLDDGTEVRVNQDIRKAYLTALAREKNALFKTLDAFNN